MRSKKWFMVKGSWFMVMAMMVLTLLTGCKQEDDRTETVPARHWVEKTVAVVAPIGDAATKARLERTASWFLQNFREAQMHDTLAIDLKIAWYDELSANLAELSTRLASDSTVVAVIGPFSNEGVAEFAPACIKTQKPLIAPTATSEDVIRRYAVTTSGQSTNQSPFLWSLTETDVNFTGLLMSGFATESKYYEYQYKDILEDDELTDATCGVFTPDDAYGMTFNYWAPFYAQEVGITLQRNRQFGSSAGLLSLLGEYRPVMRESPFVRSAIFCAVETAQQMYDVVRDNRKAMLDDPVLADMLPSTDPDDPANDQFWQLFNATYQTYFAFSGLSEDALTALGPRGTKILQGTEGFSPYADPGTGFELSYKTRFSQLPTFAECKFYDALMLAAFAACYVEHRPTAAEPSSLFTLHSSFNQAIIAITSGSAAAPMGGSAWDATAMEIYLSALERGQLLHFIGASGEIAFDRDTYTAATTTTYVRWQIIDDQIVHRQYFGTTGGRTTDANAAWLYLYNEQQADADFRQQASGGTDLLGGTDQLPKAVVDYDSRDLTARDIADILMGRASSRLPVVLPQDEGHNVLFFWSGHGSSQSQGGADEFVWRDDYAGQGFTAELLRQTASQMKFRKLLIAAEPCYGECVIRAVEGIPGVLAMSGASAAEQSWADHWNNDARIWMCDRFSLNLVTCLTDNPQSSFRDLFLYCAQHTLGSHAKIVNADHYGNLFTTGPAEFILYNK